jgi:hypothetical protein
MTASKNETTAGASHAEVWKQTTFPDAPPLSRLALFNPNIGTYTPLTGPISINDKQNLYVLTHGWAAGYSKLVHDYAEQNSGAMLTVWETLNYPQPGSTPAGAWIFNGTTAKIPVCPNGLAMTICEYDLNSVVLVYSWLDGAATPHADSDANLSNSGASLYGLLAAQAIAQAVSGSKPHGIHLLGHSDGAKVMTVAAAELVANGIQVAHLTLFDSPEDGAAHSGNSANYVWFFLSGLTTTRTPTKTGGGTFVDNYVSLVGTDLSVFSYTPPSGSPVDLSQIVDTNLKPGVLYGPRELAQKHEYAPAWYSGASPPQSPPPSGQRDGLAWSPLLFPKKAPELSQVNEQHWTGHQGKQFFLSSQTPPAAKTPTFTSLPWSGATLTIDKDNPRPTATYDIDVGVGAADGFSFTYNLVGSNSAGRQATLTATINDTLLFTMTANASGTATRAATLNAGSLRLGKGTLTFTLTGPLGSSASVSGLNSFSGAIS